MFTQLSSFTFDSKAQDITESEALKSGISVKKAK